jgi:hypothetical protein
MSDVDVQQTPPSQVEAVPDVWPPPWARMVGFTVGMGLMIFEAVIERSAHLFVYGIGFLLTGLPIARGLERVLDLFGKGK